MTGSLSPATTTFSRSKERIALALLFFVVVLCSIGASEAVAQKKQMYSVVYPYGNRVNLNVLMFNGKEYVSITEASKVLFPRSKTVRSQGVEIVTGTTRIGFAPASFFVRVQSPGGIRMAQMPYPSIEIAQELYVPLFPFLRSAEVCGVLSTTLKGRTIAIARRAATPQFRTFEEEETIATLFEPALPKTVVVEKKEDGIITGLEAPPEVWTVRPLYAEDRELDAPPQRRAAPSESRQPPPPARYSILDDEGKAALRSSIALADADMRSLGRAAPIAPAAPADIIPSPPSSTSISKAKESTSKQELPAVPNAYQLPGGLRRRDVAPPIFTPLPPSETKPEQPATKTPPKNDKPVEINPEGRKRYILPPDLQRRDGSASLNTQGESLLLASLAGYSLSEMLQQPAILDIVYNDLEGTIVFYANTTIESFQKPEIQGSTITFRIAGNLKHAAPNDTKKINDHPKVKSFSVREVGSFLVYSLTLALTPHKAEASRRSPSSVALSFATEATPTEPDASKWSLDVIVLDPGHGGEDPGAVGVKGTKEKDVALSIAKKVQAMLKSKLPGTKVILTRNDDTFVEVFDRGQIANKHNAKLFISIHCNSTEKKPSAASGSETFILRPGRNDDAQKVAQRENSVVKLEKNPGRYRDLTDEEFIIIAMAQRSFVKLSDRFAELVQKNVTKKTPLPDRGVKQAGFYVLVGASMPNVLFEAGFLSNLKEEQYLASDKGQTQIAEGLVQAIVEYSDEYESLVRKK